MRVVCFGSGTFSAPALEAIRSTRHEVVGVFTQPPRPSGRGGKLAPTPLAEAARAAGLNPVECPDINAPQAVERIRALRPDVICVVDFGQFIRQAVMDSAPLGAFNVHGSLLPELRGAAPVQWAILRGCRRTGVTTFRIVKAMDAGPIYLQEATEIGPDETADELRHRLAGLGAQLACRTLDLLETGSAEPTEQDHSKATLAPRLKKADGLIDWSADAESICRRIRGTWSWPGAQAVLDRAGHRVPVTIALARPESAAAGAAPPVPPGTVEGDLAVATGGGRLRIVRIRPAGRRLMDWKDFVNGYRVQGGDRFLAATIE